MTGLKQDHTIQTAILSLIAAMLLLAITLIGKEFAKLDAKMSTIDNFTSTIHKYEIKPNTARIKGLSKRVKDNEKRLEKLEANAPKSVGAPEPRFTELITPKKGDYEQESKDDYSYRAQQRSSRRSKQLGRQFERVGV